MNLLGSSAQAAAAPDHSPMESDPDLSSQYKATKERAKSLFQDLITQYQSLLDVAKLSQSALATAKQSLVGLYLQIKDTEKHYAAARDKVNAYDNLSPKLQFSPANSQHVLNCFGNQDMANMVAEAFDAQQVVRDLLAEVDIGELRRGMFVCYEKGTALDERRRELEERVADLEDGVERDGVVRERVERDLVALRSLVEPWRG